MIIQRFLFRVSCIQGGEVRGNGAEQIHGVLFSWLGELDPDRATMLHDRASKPLVVTGLEGRIVKKNGFMQMAEGECYQFWVHSLDHFAYKALVLLLEKLPGNRLFHLGTSYFRLEMVETPDSPIPYEKLLEDALLEKDRKEVRLRFVTPTSFRNQGIQELFPRPSLVFGSLLNRWNQFHPHTFPGERENEFDRLLVSRYELRTELLPFSRYKIIGFTGNVEYRLPENLSAYSRLQVGVLTQYAPYAGVGYKTTMGMGRVEIVMGEGR